MVCRLYIGDWGGGGFIVCKMFDLSKVIIKVMLLICCCVVVEKKMIIKIMFD